MIQTIRSTLRDSFIHFTAPHSSSAYLRHNTLYHATLHYTILLYITLLYTPLLYTTLHVTSDFTPYHFTPLQTTSHFTSPYTPNRIILQRIASQSIITHNTTSPHPTIAADRPKRCWTTPTKWTKWVHPSNCSTSWLAF